MSNLWPNNRFQTRKKRINWGWVSILAVGIVITLSGFGLLGGLLYAAFHFIKKVW